MIIISSLPYYVPLWEWELFFVSFTFSFLSNVLFFNYWDAPGVNVCAKKEIFLQSMKGWDVWIHQKTVS